MNYNFTNFFGRDLETFLSIIDSMYDEVFIVDGNYNLIYVNKACTRHYGCNPENMIGRTTLDLVDSKWWEPSILPAVYRDKKAYAIKQRTFTGSELLTIALPLFDENDEIKYVVMNVRDTINDIDLYNPHYISKTDEKDSIEAPIYKSKDMDNLISFATRIGNIDATCIITGESGTGKTMLAKYMHFNGIRKDRPFVSLNCASLPSELLESELFGYTKGAFTGANASGKKGLLEVADTGTILLDEISELTLSAQAKLLHVFQEKQYTPVGGTAPITVDIKIIAATNKNLKNLVELGQFREDLYYRLNVIEIYIPSLRKRKEDIPILIHHFLNQFCLKYGVTRQISDRAIQVLIEFEWKGNVRELQHIIERLVVMTDSLLIDVINLPINLFGLVDSSDAQSQTTRISENSNFAEKIEDYERCLVCEAYRTANSSRKLANALSISQSKANKLIRKYISIEK